MTKENLAIILTPCIFWNEKNDPLIELVYTKKLVEICKLMFEF